MAGQKVFHEPLGGHDPRLGTTGLGSPSNGGSSVYGTKLLTRATAGVKYTNNAQRTEGNDVKMILFSLAYITPIRFPYKNDFI